MATASPPTDHLPSFLQRVWRYGRALFAPILIWVLLLMVLWQPVIDWLQSAEVYDRAAMQEWIEEARNADSTLAELVAGYARRAGQHATLRRQLMEARKAGDPVETDLFLRTEDAGVRVAVKREEIQQHLRALGEPVTKMYPGQLPLFPVVYRMEIYLELPEDVETVEGSTPIVWDSGLEPSSGQQSRDAVFDLRAGSMTAGRVHVRYQLRAWNKRQRDEALKARRLQQLALLAFAATALGLAWLRLLGADERESLRQHQLTRERIDQAERQRLEEERRRVETERELLEQRLATQAAEQKAIELRSNLYASIGIMAGSYAHNIKNLLVRPNDLLRRCLERTEVAPEEARMLREVQQTLAMVTERLQQILHTVRRDPSRSEAKRLNLAGIVAGLARTWGEMASDRWQLDLTTEVEDNELWVSADESHLGQALENLLFNARDATFEMRNQLRETARRREGQDPGTRRQALLAAAGWRGKVEVRCRTEGTQPVLEVKDNGAGMTEEVRARCTQTHFSTKRDNALYEGHSTGMGLGLSFVVAILENHDAKLEIESLPLAGTTFRIRFPGA